MKEYEKESKMTTVAIVSRITAYLFIVIFISMLIINLCNVDVIIVSAEEPGITDLTSFDFDNYVAQISTEITDSVIIYPNVFYMPEDFDSEGITTAGIQYKRERFELGDYGTLRMVISIPQNQIYAITGKNVSYAQRLFIDGKEYSSIGVPGDGLESIVPKTTRYIEGFTSNNETTEFIIHYSNFVHSDGGGLYPLEIGLVKNVVRNEKLRTFSSAIAVTASGVAALFFFCLFLLFRKGPYFLWFASICACFAFRSLMTGNKMIMLLLPNLNWYLAIRSELIFTVCLALLSALYIDSLFPGAAKRWYTRGVTVLCCGIMFFIGLTPPILFSRFTEIIVGSLVGIVVCQLLVVLHLTLRKKTTSHLSKLEQILLLSGLLIYATFSVFGIYAHQRSITFFGLDYPQVGMLVFMFINVLVLVLGFLRTEEKLNRTLQIDREIRETNQILAQLNRTKIKFLANISHEMKTPLAVMSNCAGLTLKEVRHNAVNIQTEKNLDTIQKEAVRLGRLVDQLMRVAFEEERQNIMTLTDAKSILQRAADFCLPICSGKGNSILVHTEQEYITLPINEDNIFQVLVNVITNANKQTQGGIIKLSAKYEEDAVVFEVTDNGKGIDSALIDRIFERGVSGDGGTGLGLPICKEIIEEHGGQITIESSQGIGTQVRFRLPCFEGDRAE